MISQTACVSSGGSEYRRPDMHFDTLKKRFRRFAAPLAALGALFAFQSAHAAGATDTERLLHGFMRDTYGGWRADLKGWQPGEGFNIYRPCASLRVGTPDGPRYLLAMCGATPDSERQGAQAMDAPGQSGTLDLYVLKPAADGRHLEAVLKKTDIASGNDGVPGGVSIERLGPHLFGFVEREGATLQGYSQSMRMIWLPRGDALVLAAPRINEALDNLGSLDCGQAKSRCETRSFAIAPDTTGSDDVYPLTVIETGTRGERDIHARYAVRFDAARGRYVVPKALREGY